MTFLNRFRHEEREKGSTFVNRQPEVSGNPTRHCSLFILDLEPVGCGCLSGEGGARCLLGGMPYHLPEGYLAPGLPGPRAGRSQTSDSERAG